MDGRHERVKVNGKDGRRNRASLTLTAKRCEQLAHLAGSVGVALVAGFFDAAAQCVAGFGDAT
jgi:hypothetical protein